MSADSPANEFAELQIDGTCPECGAPFRAGVWDHSYACAFCDSLLVSARAFDEEVFVASDASDAPVDVTELLVQRAVRDYASSLVARFRAEEGVQLEIPGWVEAKSRAYEARMRAEISVVETVDFFAPYEIHEQTVAQGILGRRIGVKETFVQGFEVEDIRRLYDPAAYNLRDRGLKIHGFHLQRIGEAHLQAAENRFLAVAEPDEAGAGETSAWTAPARNASKVNLRAGTDVVAMIDGTVRERRLRVYKHLTWARVEQAGRRRDVLVDHQFGTVAGEIRPEEVPTFRDVPPLPTAQVLTPPEVHAIASECPNCGWELELPRRERIAFCPTCALGIHVTAKGLEAFPYRSGPLPDTGHAPEWLGFPFWAFRFRVRARDREFTRIWDWLEEAAPQPVARQFAASDPESSLLFVPARALYGAEEIDDAFAQLSGWANWCQPALSRDRLTPDGRGRRLGVELDTDDAAQLARFTLLALHDVQSTRRLNGRNFSELIADAQLDLGQPFLASLPLPIRDAFWSPDMPAPSAQPVAYRRVGSTLKGVTRSVLDGEARLPRAVKRFALY